MFIYNIGTFGIAHLRFGQILLNALIHRLYGGVDRTVTANQVLDLMGIRTNHRHLAEGLGQRQDAALVLQQDDGFQSRP